MLITGASGGVGHLAVQIAKHYGADVTAVCSTPKIELVRSLGADRVIDYGVDDFTRNGSRYDLIAYIAGTHSLGECRRALTPDGTLVRIGSSKPPRGLFSVLASFVTPKVMTKLTEQRFETFMTSGTREMLEFLARLAADGELTPIVDRTYPLEETPAAIAYQHEGHSRGKVVLTV